MPLRLIAARYGIAALAVLVGTAVRLALTPLLGPNFPFATLFLAVLVAAWHGGRGPAVAATFLGAISSAFLLLPPYRGFQVPAPYDLMGLLLYVAVGLGIAELGGRMRESRIRAERQFEAQLHADAALRESEERFRLFMRNLPGLAWIKDPQGRYVYVNEAAARTFRHDVQAILGRSDRDLFPPGTAAQFRANDERALADPSGVQVVETLRHEDGLVHHSIVSKFAIPGRSGEVMVGGMAIDITERRTAEETLRQSEERLRLALDALREADRRKDEFLALLGHELRNPLAPISNAVHILKLPGTDEAIHTRAREMIERQVEHLVRLVDDLLDVSRIMRGKIELRREIVELATVVARAVETSQSTIDAEGHTLKLSLTSEPVWVHGDLVRLAQVVSNLLNNAAKFTDRGGTIRLSAAREQGDAVVRVRDTGVGVTPEDRARIFDTFFQAERGAEGARGGLGIGLSVVRGLVELHGGSVEVASEGAGRGSEFIVRLPSLAPEPKNEGRGPEAAEIRPWPRRRVLVVDDNADAADSLALLLRLEGQEVLVAYDAASAFAAAAEKPPAVAFLDLGIPDVDGYELARRFRSDPVLREVRLVALTGWGQEEDRRRTSEAGFERHLVKPVSPDALREIVETMARNETK